MNTNPVSVPKVTILIKAFNEEARIAACLEAALREASLVDGDVILVDSLSSDRTIEVARQFSVQIIQFANSLDCGCGAAVQLGYQFARGDFIYVLDSDMVLQHGFVKCALERLIADPRLAGVAGKIVDTQIRTIADRRRVSQAAALQTDTYVEELGGGGLYRREAIRSVNYLSNRNLKAYEEADLGARLRSRGWKLLRITIPAVLHEGHSESNRQMLVRLWKNQRAQSTGVFIKSSIFRPWFLLVVRKLAHVFAVPAMHLGQLFVLLFSPGGWVIQFLVGYWLTLFIVVGIKKKSFIRAFWSISLWHYLAFASVFGFFSSLQSPEEKVLGVVLKERSGMNAPLIV